jgi:hypothetical protein
MKTRRQQVGRFRLLRDVQTSDPCRGDDPRPRDSMAALQRGRTGRKFDHSSRARRRRRPQVPGSRGRGDARPPVDDTGVSMKMGNRTQLALVTGASSGIGRAFARRLGVTFSSVNSARPLQGEITWNKYLTQAGWRTSSGCGSSGMHRSRWTTVWSFVPTSSFPNKTANIRSS